MGGTYPKWVMPAATTTCLAETISPSSRETSDLRPILRAVAHELFRKSRKDGWDISEVGYACCHHHLSCGDNLSVVQRDFRSEAHTESCGSRTLPEEQKGWVGHIRSGLCLLPPPLVLRRQSLRRPERLQI